MSVSELNLRRRAMCTYVTVPKTGDSSVLSHLSVGGSFDRKTCLFLRQVTMLYLVTIGQMAWGRTQKLP